MRILIVEDEIDLLKALEKGLKNEGYAVDIASDGEEAYDYIDVNDYDLIVLDINLPKINGLELLENIRKNDNDTRVIIVSANREIDDRIRGLDLGANDYLVKPFDLLELKARIRALLRRDFSSKPVAIDIDGLKIDLSTHKVTYNDEILKLTLKEYSILIYLVENRGKIISSEELMNHIWDDNANPFTTSIRVHIYSLRKKLANASGGKNMIDTIKGVGYIFGEVNNE